MADLIGTTHQGTASPGQSSARAKFDEAAASTKSLGEQAMSTGRDLADKAKNIAESSTDAIKGQGSDLVDAAKDVASQATDRLKDAVNDRKSSGAEGLTPDKLDESAREIGQRVRRVAESAVTTAFDPDKSPQSNTGGGNQHG